MPKDVFTIIMLSVIVVMLALIEIQIFKIFERVADINAKFLVFRMRNEEAFDYIQSDLTTILDTQSNCIGILAEVSEDIQDMRLESVDDLGSEFEYEDAEEEEDEDGTNV